MEEAKLYIPQSVSDKLPSMVINELRTLSAQKQEEFMEEYNRKRKSVGMAYLFQLLLLGTGYAYLGKWGLQILLWITVGGLGIWALILLFMLPGMVKNYNKDIALDVIRNMQAIATPR